MLLLSCCCSFDLAVGTVVIDAPVVVAVSAVAVGHVVVVVVLVVVVDVLVVVVVVVVVRNCQVEQVLWWPFTF